MAPWSSRLLNSNPRVESSSSIATVGPAPESPSKNRGRARITEADILDNAYGIPTLITGAQQSRPGPSGSSSSKPTSSHGRSMSHPFPSLFNSKKKGSAPAPPGVGFFDDDDDDDVSPEKNTGGRSSRVPDKDFLTGKCMTCNASVSWPKELDVFRCKVCTTVNDLQPYIPAPNDGRKLPGGGKSTTFPGLNKPQVSRVAPLSVEKTRRLAERCITTYLINRLKHDETDASNILSTSPRSPTFAITESPQEYESRNFTNPPGSQAVPIRPPPPGHGKTPGDRPGMDIHKQPGPRSIPYSTSSPGSFLGTHMEKRDRMGSGTYVRPLAIPQPSRSPPNPPSKFDETMHGKQDNVAKNLFRPLEEYIIASFSQFDCINTSFSTTRQNPNPKGGSQSGLKTFMATIPDENDPQSETPLEELDPRMLMLGDIAENGSWWTGNQKETPEKNRAQRPGDTIRTNPHCDLTTVKSPRIDWPDLNEWYHIVSNPGRIWHRKLEDLISRRSSPVLQAPTDGELVEIEDTITEAQSHLQRTLLKATEGLLKRPGRPLKEPDNLRFLLIILANPLLYPGSSAPSRNTGSRVPPNDQRPEAGDFNLPKARGHLPSSKPPPNATKGASGQHSGIIKRIVGLLSNTPNECHHHIVSWFARYPEGHFQRTTELVGSFVTYRLTRQHGKPREVGKPDMTSGLIPQISASASHNNVAAFHAALQAGQSTSKKKETKLKAVVYSDDWQIKAAARVMALLFSANNSGLHRKGKLISSVQSPADHQSKSTEHSIGTPIRALAAHGQMLPTSHFYNTLLDYSDLVADFEAWEGKRSKFAFCQYPFFLSIWAKIQIMEHDARRQMEVKAREAFFNSIMTRKNVNQYLLLKVRRECLVEDSLKGVSEVVGTGGEEIKKGLRIEFRGEEGIDAGGLRKEWFLLLVRDVFNPDHGMFSYDEDSHFCYFNPNSFETTDQYFLVGVVLGLAIYNSTILDVALPPFAFRKLLASAPAAAPGATSHAKPSMSYSLEDLSEYRPALAHGLRQLLEFDGDVEATFCRDFVADVDRYGQTIQVPLCPDGGKKPVTNANRREFVDLYVRYLLDNAVARQFEPFKRGFFTVCGGNALSLFRPEEIELLIRGSDEPLDITSLRAVSVCDNWGAPNAAEREPVIQWFWESFQRADPKDQRKLLSFITGSSCIPAMGATSLVIKLSCLGDDSERFPVARTCFNMLSLWRYASREKLEGKLWRAVHESEGFGLK
ncbi:putative E3 ubiquitin-protein ligase [Ciborinia camelliae]|nr:putative E3 ubiquitin-protein ligase [Ciborinia camelliae]